MGAWAQGQRRGGLRTLPIGATYAATDITWSPYMVVVWTSDVDPTQWEVRVEQNTGSWGVLVEFAALGNLRAVNLFYAPVGGRQYRFRLRGWFGSLPGPWSDWYTETAP